jgi:hypothetical protein
MYEFRRKVLCVEDKSLSNWWLSSYDKPAGTAGPAGTWQGKLYVANLKIVNNNVDYSGSARR